MAATLEKIYEVALHHYHMKLVAGREGLSNLVDWVHVVEEIRVRIPGKKIWCSRKNPLNCYRIFWRVPENWKSGQIMRNW